MTIQNLSCKLIQKNGKKTEIEIEGQSLVIPSEFIPSGVAAGEELSLCFLSSKDAKIKEDNLAKLILEEILNGK
jgi:hypothetical protein